MIPWLLEPDASVGENSKSTSVSTTHKVFAQLGAKLAAQDCIDAKEFFEAAEFYLRTRRRVRRPLVLDCCCGHGLAGLMFAAFEPSVLAVKLVDQRRPPSFDRVFAAVVEAAPWAEAKVLFFAIAAQFRTASSTTSLKFKAITNDFWYGMFICDYLIRALPGCLFKYVGRVPRVRPFPYATAHCRLLLQKQ